MDGTASKARQEISCPNTVYPRFIAVHIQQDGLMERTLL